MIRITAKPLATGTLVKIDGDLDREDVSEVNAVCGSAAGPVVLDLADLRTLDSDGEECLRRLIDDGATVDAAAPYIRVRLGLSA
ncbi:MAG: hypothetical protein JSU86_09560 [Phycisphaerales bacterium]|nr:MAG: hypothetical protein JSU86_09560 [Phycisphaerales bacterium]